MTETRLGRQTPTQSVTIPYSKTRGQEAAELYAKTGNELLEWQQLLQCDIMAVNDYGCIKNMAIQCRDEMESRKMC